MVRAVAAERTMAPQAAIQEAQKQGLIPQEGAAAETLLVILLRVLELQTLAAVAEATADAEPITAALVVLGLLSFLTRHITQHWRLLAVV